MSPVTSAEKTLVISSIRDISERKAIETALQESRERFRSLFEQSPYAICSILPDGTITATNSAMERLTGYAPEGLIGRSVLELVSPVRRDAAVARQAAIAKGKAMQFETVIRTNDGIDFHAVVDTSPILVGSALVGIFVTVKDTTREHALGRGAKDSAERIKALYRVASSNETAAATQIDQALFVAANALEMPYGFVTQVVDGVMTVLHRHGPGNLLPVGFTMPVAASIGARLAASPRAIAIEDLTVEPYASELRARGLPWQSYIGSRIIVEHEPFGALILMDTSIRAGKFDAADFDFIDLTSWMVGSAVAREINERRLEDLAFHDRLTGLANRRVLEDHLGHALAFARREGSTIAVHYIDLDGFKPINDRLGHAAGDEVLCEVARRFTDVLRGQDILARVGGDEFVAVQMAIEDDDAVNLLTRRLKASLDKQIELSNGATVTIGASFGVAVYPKDGNTLEELVEVADSAMLAGKPSRRV